MTSVMRHIEGLIALGCRGEHISLCRVNVCQKVTGRETDVIMNLLTSLAPVLLGKEHTGSRRGCQHEYKESFFHFRCMFFAFSTSRYLKIP